MNLILVVCFALVLAVVATVAACVMLYNGLVQVKHNVDRAWADVDVLLKQRHDELPKLIDAVKGYLVHERELLTRITELRARAGSASTESTRIEAEQALSAGVGRLLAVAEGYPDLKSSQNFAELQRRVSALEDGIAHRREFYNDAVNLQNVRMEQIPDAFLAGFAGLTRRALFEATDAERGDVDLGARLRA